MAKKKVKKVLSEMEAFQKHLDNYMRMANKKQPEPIIITEDDFFDNYIPRTNHIERVKQSRDVADADLCSWNGCMYETYGREVDFVVSVANNPKTKKKVWTIIEGDNNKQYIVAGYHLINRMGYLITKKSWKTGLEEVEID
jgi:uncharacterized short protein YbdD (DUF466 family)